MTLHSYRPNARYMWIPFQHMRLPDAMRISHVLCYSTWGSSYLAPAWALEVEPCLNYKILRYLCG